MSITLLHADCLDLLPTLPAESMDSCVCDPPYHLTSIVKRFGSAAAAPAKGGVYARSSAGFMGQQWDGGDIAFRPEVWREVLRVLKPGGYLAAMSGTRNFHRLVCAIEDAGFEIRDTISNIHDGGLDGPLLWVYASGFPKSSRVNRDPRFCQCGGLAHSDECIDRAPSQDGHICTEVASCDGVPLRVNVGRSTNRAPNSQDDCRQDRDSNGEQLRPAATSAQAFAPLQQHVLEHNHSCVSDDARAPVSSDSPSQVRYTNRHANKGLTRQSGVNAVHGDIQGDRTSPADMSDRADRTLGMSDNSASADYAPGFPRCQMCGKPNADGFGTALKPAVELICVARKPLSEPTVAANVLRWGTGALNIEKCRVSPSSPQLDEDVCAQLFALGSPRDKGAAVPSQRPYFVQRICAALAACSSGHTAHGHNAAGRDGHTTEADVRAAESLLSRLQSSEALYAGNWSEPLGSLLGCQTCRHFGDGHSRSVREAAQVGAPSLAGALADMCRWLYARTYSRGCPCSGHLSNSGVAVVRAALLFDLISVAKQEDTTYLAPRIESTRRSNVAEMGYHGGNLAASYQTGSTAGRWPANLCHDGSPEVLEAFARFGESKSTAHMRGERSGAVYGSGKGPTGPNNLRGSADTGTAARFFFCGKATRAERNMGCDDLDEKPLPWSSGEQNPGSFQAEGTKRSAKNNHPTVKPFALMQWLCRLVTPPGGTVLDPFLGSGSTAIAAAREGFGCVGIELSADYLAIARARLAADAPLLTEVA